MIDLKKETTKEMGEDERNYRVQQKLIQGEQLDEEDRFSKAYFQHKIASVHKANVQSEVVPDLSDEEMKNDGYTVAQDGKTWAFDEMDYEVDKTEKEELVDLKNEFDSLKEEYKEVTGESLSFEKVVEDNVFGGN